MALTICAVQEYRCHDRKGVVMAQVEDPSKYGVVVTDESGKVDRFVEKPKARDPMACRRPYNVPEI